MVVEESWRSDLERRLEPFLAGLSHPARRRMCPLYISGLIGPGDRKSVPLGKNANCQTLVSVTLASREVPVMVGLRLFLPESWTSDSERMARARVPEDRRTALTKPEIAIEEIDRIRHAGVRFGCVLADAGYGMSAPLRQVLSERGLAWAVGIPGRQKVYPADV
jgi:SRSO17 transposase